MNGKKLLSLALALVICLPVTAFAQGNGKSENSQGKGQQTVQTDKTQKQPDVKAEDAKVGNAAVNEHKQEAMQKKDDKKQQIEAFKTQMRDKHDQMKDLRDQAKVLKQEVQKKRAQLSSIVSDIISGKKTLTQDMLNQLLTIVQNLGKDTQEVGVTAEITGTISDTQAKVNKGDFNNALTSMDGVIAKLQARLDALTKLNADLDKALAIANLAAVPAPTPAPGTTPTTPPSGDQTSTGTQTTGTTDQTTTGTTQQTTGTTGDTQQTSGTTAQ